jgi:hypothetical protein
MKQMYLLIVAPVISALVLLASCSALDLVARSAESSFAAMAAAANTERNKADGSWTITSQGGERFRIYPGTTPRVAMIFDATQFLIASLDFARLAKEYSFDFNARTLTLTSELGTNPISTEPGSIEDAFKSIVANYRSRIGYHDELDHFRIEMGGNAFEWAKDMKKNEADIVFVLDAAPLVSAGLDPYRPEGWKLMTVTVKNANGANVKAERLIRAFNLK